jgi:hypothetical protein
VADKTRNNCPLKLYKYRSLSNDVERLRVKDILLNNQLFFPTRLGFNDPFDCRISLSWAVSEDEMARKLLEVYERNPPIGFKGRIKDFIKARREDGSVASLLDKVTSQRLTEAGLDKPGILCLCEKSDDILMWSHYAENHRGICLEFNVAEKVFFSGAIQVIYSEEYPRLHAAMVRDDLANGLLRTKALHWAYEREWRVFAPAGGKYPFPKESLSGVVLGCQMVPEHEALIQEWLSKRKSRVNLYRAVKSDKKFALDIKDLKVIGPPVL